MLEDDSNVIEGLPSINPMLNESIGKLIYDGLLANCSDKPALIDLHTNECITYRQLLKQTCSLATKLQELGCNENTILAISSENNKEFFIPIIAALYIGATVVPINHLYGEAEIKHALNISSPELIFCSKLVLPKFMSFKNDMKFIKKLIVIDEETNEDTDTLASLVDKDVYRFDVSNVQVDEHVALILYSSGTTGLPKGVMITHRNIIIQILINYDHRLTPQERGKSVLGILPFFHAYGLFMTLFAIMRQTLVVVMKKFEEHLFLSTIEKYKITSLPLVPSLAVFLAKSPLVNQYDVSSVEYVTSGAASISKHTIDVIKQRFNLKKLRQGYGLTESTLAATILPLDSSKQDSVGVVAPYTRCKIRDPKTGKSLGPNQVGEICIKGPTIMKGYFRNEEATKNSYTRDGWLMTGDLGYYDSEKYFFIVGRLKELIKYKGFQVPPVELETLLLSNSQIKDAAVIGIPDEDAGELPMAFVVKNQNCNITEAEIQNFIAGIVSSQKRLRGGVRFILEIPKNTTGKIMRKKLLELYTNSKAKL